LFPSGYHKPFRHNIQEASSILHARAPEITMANPNLPDFKLHHYQEGVMKNPVLKETIESFPLYVSGETGWHYRLENQKELSKDDNMGKDSVLVMVVFNDENSWGKNDTLTRSMDDFFKLLETFQYPKKKISITMLTSSMSEYNKLREKFMDKIEIYPRLSLIYRNDFMVGSNLNRENRHASSLQNDRRRMLARYRNYALQMTLASWHNHVVWIDADVVVIPNDTLSRMVKCKFSIRCSRTLYLI
jgi:mannan polymerase complexes MNN9 subunit